MPANSNLAALEISLAGIIGRETVLRQYIETAKALYDYIIIDTAPTLDLLTINSLLKLIGTVSALDRAFAHPFPAPVLFDITIGLIGASAIFFAVLYRRFNRKKWRKDIEYGSARWGNRKDIEPFVDKVPEKNVILTATESLMLNGRPPNPKHARNKNILVIGGSGSGKTRFWLKPNLMQMHSSYVVTDPKGTVLVETGKMLQRGGYEIKVLNTIDFKKSMHYNPFPLLYKGGKRNNPQIQGSHYVCGTNGRTRHRLYSRERKWL